MSAGQSEPEKYSIDEMMERLKTRPSGDPSTGGELVVRDDGTQMIRVRKRKRRSHQPKKEQALKERRTRAIQIVAIITLIGAIAITLGAIFVYANSAPYRNGIIAKITASSGARVDLRQFRVNPFGANAEAITFAWPDGNTLKSLSLRGVGADVAFASFIGKSWRGEEILAREGELTLGLPEEGSNLVAQPRPEGGSPIEFGRMAVGKLNITLGKPGQPALRLTGTEGSLYPRNASGRPQIRLNRGELKMAEWPAFRLDRALIEFRGSLTDVVGIRLFDPDDDLGYFELSGTIDPYNPQTDSTLKARLDSFPIQTVLGPELGRILSGRIDSREVAEANYLNFNTRGDEGADLVIAFRPSLSSQIQWSSLPVFTVLARGLADEWFQTPVFADDSTGIIHRGVSTIRLTDLSFTNKGRMAIRGDLTLNTDQTLRGTLRIGIAEAMIASSPSEALSRVFPEISEGFRWVELTIGGSSTRPTDNFSQLYEAAMSTGKAAPGTPGNATDDFEDLTRPR